MGEPIWTPAYGWGSYGPYAVQSGQTIRMGLTWPGNPGPVSLTISCGTIPSTLIREHATREMASTASYYQTTEWVTVTATGAYGWAEDIVLSYLGTYQADEISGKHGDIVEPPRFHVIAHKGLALAWVKAHPPLPGHPLPVIAPAQEEHTLHRDIEIDADGSDADATAQLLSEVIGR